MGRRVQEMCQHLVEHYGGDAAAVWETASSGDELFKRLKAMPGFGDQKAKIFVALLGKRLQACGPRGGRTAAKEYGEKGSFRSRRRHRLARRPQAGPGVQAADEGGGQSEGRRGQGLTG